MRPLNVSAAIRLLPALLWMVLIFMLSAQHQRPGPAPRAVSVPQGPGSGSQRTEDLFDILGHLVLYAVLAALLWWALRLVARLRWWGRLALALTGSMIYALSDEWHQAHVVGRQSSAFDLLVDAAGALIAILLITLVQWTVQRRSLLRKRIQDQRLMDEAVGSLPTLGS